MTTFETAWDNVTPGLGGDFVLPILADTVIPFIRMRSYLRQTLKAFDMPTETFKFPKIPQGSDAYHISANSVAPTAAITTGSIELNAKKLMIQIPLAKELTEDSVTPIIPIIKDDLARAFALAEEEMFLNGDVSHLATQPTPATATEADWYVNDKRLAVNGLRKIATGVSVDAANSKITLDMLSTAIENMGKYGIDKDELFYIISLREENTLRQVLGVNLALNQLGLTGTALPREIGKVWGIPVVSTTVLTKTAAVSGSNTEALLVNKSAAIIGDRRMFEIQASNEVLMAQDQVLIVASERLAFAGSYNDAIVKIQNIGTTSA